MAGNIEKLTELYNDLWQLDKRNRKQYHNLWYKISNLENEVGLPELVVFHCRQAEKYLAYPPRSGYHHFKAQRVYNKAGERSADLEARIYKNSINIKALESKKKLFQKKDLARKESQKILFLAAWTATSYMN